VIRPHPSRRRLQRRIRRRSDANAVADYAKRADDADHDGVHLGIIPTTFFDAFTGTGNLLQVLFVAILFGYAMTHMGTRARRGAHFIDACSHVFFAMMNRADEAGADRRRRSDGVHDRPYGIDSLRPLQR
jgi:aerobic C4-dicarboxylate transport protein